VAVAWHLSFVLVHVLLRFRLDGCGVESCSAGRFCCLIHPVNVLVSFRYNLPLDAAFYGLRRGIVINRELQTSVTSFLRVNLARLESRHLKSALQE
jgi:hypothetical protein